MFMCAVCNDGRACRGYNLSQHEEADAHKNNVVHLSSATITQTEPEPSNRQDQQIPDNALRHLLSSLTRGTVTPYPEASTDSPPPHSGINWNLMEANGEGDLSLSADQQAVASIAEAILERFADLPMSDDKFEERSDDEEAPSNEPEVAGQDESDTEDPNPEETRSRKRARTRDTTATSSFWYPWSDQIRQLDLYLWLLKVNNVDDVPSVKSMQTINLALQKICGIDSIPYEGALGHKYYVNSLAQIIAQEMTNPKVRPHLHFYPEDSSPKLSEARQAPVRWFTKGGQLFAKCWQMLVPENYVVPAHKFLMDFPTFQADAGRYSLPHPSLIVDVVNASTMKSTMWKYTNPVIRNRWRSKAEGHRVVAFLIWMYCDDTSGNVSKKWNEHNSFLMTPAGLPREHSQKEYNIHFLCTSNLARPLEMLDGIVEQLECMSVQFYPLGTLFNTGNRPAQDEGIWAWDMLEEEPVLVIPEVLALLGDSPMQANLHATSGFETSYFAERAGMEAVTLQVPQNSAPGSPAPSVAGLDVSETGSDAGQGKGKKGKARKIHESMSQMADRVKSFMKVGRFRHKEETTSKLRSYFTEASTVNTKTKVKNSQTENGIKDKYQTHFIKQLFDSYKNKRGVAAKQAALDAKKAELPKVTISPVWRTKATSGLDPHQDTPVEILHVVLLGFVKYLWRDVVQLQLNKKDKKKELLATRLSSLDVSGLGISPLAGQTLVRYRGSLTGRDFRAISQVASFVLYDLVSDDCFKTWQALSKIVPLIWQPEIDDIESHIHGGQTVGSINPGFTSLFTFPLTFTGLVLLSSLQRRPLNHSTPLLIRAKSVHSNRHAPSRDIAYAFAQGNRICHLISGGLFMLRTQLPQNPVPVSKTTAPTATPAHNIPASTANTPAIPVPPTAPTMILSIPIQQSRKHNWTTVGPGPQSLTATRSAVTSYLGLAQKKAVAGGLCVHDKHRPREVQATLSGVHIPTWAAKPGLFQTNQSLSLYNGDICVPGGFVIVRDSQTMGQTFVARVEEIIQQVGSLAIFSSQPDGVLLQRAFIDRVRTRYGMPSIQLSNQWSMHNAKDLLCTVNVQHNHIDNKYGPTGARTVFQERFKTNQTRAEIVHTRNVQDIVLNTAQMRDAVHLQMFRVQSETLDLNTIVHNSAAKELKVRKAGDPVPSELLAANSR
ncbi:hypothetical protein B0H14DRAFT_2597923 [Mycena olivaceomarginata]|nr:hypothetical protein B0H14DRAFT_2597923 [Mycena olivaceomarginata]